MYYVQLCWKHTKKPFSAQQIMPCLILASFANKVCIVKYTQWSMSVTKANIFKAQITNHLHHLHVQVIFHVPLPFDELADLVFPIHSRPELAHSGRGGYLHNLLSCGDTSIHSLSHPKCVRKLGSIESNAELIFQILIEIFQFPALKCLPAQLVGAKENLPETVI